MLDPQVVVQPGGVVPVDDEGVSIASDGSGNRFGRLAERPFLPVGFEALRRFEGRGGSDRARGILSLSGPGVEVGGVGAESFPGISPGANAFADGPDVEPLRVVDFAQLLPLDGHCDRGGFDAPHAVGRDDRLVGTVPVDVDEHLSTASLFLEPERGRSAVRVHERPGQVEGGFGDLGKTPLRPDGAEDVQALAARGLDEGVVSEPFDVRLECDGEGRDLLEREVFRGIQVEDDIVGPVVMRLAGVHLMQLQTGQVGDPGKRRRFGGEDVVDLVLVAERDVPDPFRGPARTVLLKEPITRNPVRVADEGEGPAVEVREDRRGDLHVVFDQLCLEDARPGKQNLVQVRELDFPFSDAGKPGRSGHRRS